MILVTGAGGFIGGAVARLLAGQPGLAVRGATQNGRALDGGILPWRLDVRDPASAALAVAGVEAIVHCAVGDRATTVDGTRTLLQAARAAGVGRVVHLSSVSVYGDADGAVTETTRLVSPEGGGYAQGKAAAEAICHEGGLPVAMLRPAIVYGPGSRLWASLPARRLRSGAWAGLGELGRGTCNLVHVDDVAAACLAAIRSPDLQGCQAFNVSGRERLTWRGYYAAIAEGLGCPTLRDISVQAWRRRSRAGLPFKALARLWPNAGKLFERPILAAPAGAELALFALEATYPTDKAASTLGWQPQTDLAEGLAGMLAWLRTAEAPA